MVVAAPPGGSHPRNASEPAAGQRLAERHVLEVIVDHLERAIGRVDLALLDEILAQDRERKAILGIVPVTCGAFPVGDPGLEPGTSSLSEKRSNRLS